MITRIHPQITLGGELDCLPGLQLAGTKATIHANKFPCWQRYAKSNQLTREHPNYLAFTYPFDLVLNIIDPDIPLFKPETFAMARAFAANHLRKGNQLFIHCNAGLSRAPSLALLILAKDLNAIDNESYDKARQEFEAFYPQYKPGLGIEKYMREHWNTL